MKKLRLISVLIPTLLILAYSNNLIGQTVHNHDGFFLRIQTGGGHINLDESNVLGRDLTLSGFGGIFSGQVGGVISPNLIAFGAVSGAIVSDPDLDWGGETAKTTETELSITGMGAGVTYYFMPSNFYCSVSALLSFVTLEFEDMKGESEPGIGITFSLGKEWWVADDWGIGAALWGHFSTMDAKDTPEVQTIENLAYGIVFSATFN